MNSELDEEYGAGFEGTNGLLYKYLKDTPGQKIVKHMNTKNTELEEIAPQLDEKIYADDYKISSEKSQFGGYRPHLINKRTGKTMYLSAASYNTPKEAEKHAKSYLDQYARGVSEPRVPVTGTYAKEVEVEIGPRSSGDRNPFADDYEVSSEKSQFGGYRPHLINTRTGKTMYLSAASYKTPKEAEKHAKNYLDQYARGISEPKVPVTGTYTEGVGYGILKNSLSKLGFKEAPLRGFKDLPKEDIYTLYGIPMRAGKWADVWFATLEDMYAIVNDEEVTMFEHMGNALKRLGQIGVQQKEETQISTPLLRTMKIVSLATGCTDHDALYEYALTAPTYSSIVELKENFNIYIQTQ